MAISYFYATPGCKLSTNAPNLVDRIVFKARAAGTCSVRANIPQFDTQLTTCKCSTNMANLVDSPVFRANAIGRCSTPLAQLYGRLAESSLTAQLSNQFIGSHHRIITPLSVPMTLIDTYIDSFSWSGMAGGGHVVEITDSRGAILGREVAGQASDGSFSCVRVNRVARGGYFVKTLDSGVLVINVERPIRNSHGGRG